jgi:hypothetical protein|tara:strand:- start:91 stop:321 length:231 start_codon:yes stop_codon:yes gene_type:complete
MGNRRQETGRVVMGEIEKVREELGDDKATKLRQLREYSKALIEMGRCRNREGREDLSNCLSQANEILAEAGIISNR